MNFKDLKMKELFNDLNDKEVEELLKSMETKAGDENLRLSAEFLAYDIESVLKLLYVVDSARTKDIVSLTFLNGQTFDIKISERFN